MGEFDCRNSGARRGRASTSPTDAIVVSDGPTCFNAVAEAGPDASRAKSEALAANRTDEPLDVGILPRGARRDEDFLDTQTVRATAKLRARNGVAVTKQIPGRPSRRFLETCTG